MAYAEQMCEHNIGKSLDASLHNTFVSWKYNLVGALALESNISTFGCRYVLNNAGVGYRKS